ncbi:MAG TPA: DoxX family protein [Dongiaceae bacterium]|jgi:putative oxidoreductase|nr:DoxX family protein [Dongiaceae bacterium]
MLDSLRFLPLLGRILIASLFLPAGFGKLTGFKGAVDYAAAAHMPVPSLAIAAAIAIELGCGLLLLVGWKARWAAAAMALFSVVAALFFHTNFADSNMQIHFFKNLAIAGGLLNFVYFGAGPLSVDNRA